MAAVKGIYQEDQAAKGDNAVLNGRYQLLHLALGKNLGFQPFFTAVQVGPGPGFGQQKPGLACFLGLAFFFPGGQAQHNAGSRDGQGKEYQPGNGPEGLAYRGPGKFPGLINTVALHRQGNAGSRKRHGGANSHIFFYFL